MASEVLNGASVSPTASEAVRPIGPARRRALAHSLTHSRSHPLAHLPRSRTHSFAHPAQIQRELDVAVLLRNQDDDVVLPPIRFLFDDAVYHVLFDSDTPFFYNLATGKSQWFPPRGYEHLGQHRRRKRVAAAKAADAGAMAGGVV